MLILAIGCFFFCFDIEILHSVHDVVVPHHRSPVSAIRPTGQDLWRPMAPKTVNTTAPVAAKCQYYLDNIVAPFEQTLAFDDLADICAQMLRNNRCNIGFNSPATTTICFWQQIPRLLHRKALSRVCRHFSVRIPMPQPAVFVEPSVCCIH